MLEIIDKLLDVIDGTCMAIYLTYILTPKFKKKYRPIAVVFFVTVLFLINLTDKMVPNLPFQLRIETLLSILVFFLYIVVLFKEPFGKKCIQFIFIAGVLFIIDSISALIMFKVYNLPMEITKFSINCKIFAHILYIFISLIAYFIAFYVFKKKDVFINKHQGIILILFFSTELFMILNSIYVHKKSITNSLFLSLLIEITACIIIDVIVIASMKKMNEISERKNTTHIKKLNDEYVEELKAENIKFRMLRHDIKNTISVAEILLDENRNSEAIELLDGFTSDLNNTISKNNQ